MNSVFILNERDFKTIYNDMLNQFQKLNCLKLTIKI